MGAAFLPKSRARSGAAARVPRAVRKERREVCMGGGSWGMGVSLYRVRKRAVFGSATDSNLAVAAKHEAAKPKEGIEVHERHEKARKEPARIVPILFRVLSCLSWTLH